MSVNNMSIQLVCVILMIFVTLSGASQIMSRQAETCEFYPQIKCSKDCSAIIACHNRDEPAVRRKCPATEPYCVNKKCGKFKKNCPTTTIENVENLLCSSDGTDGIFPDPTNCSNFYKCSNGIAMKDYCGEGSIFDSKSGECVTGVPRLDHASKKICKKISCAKKSVGYILFPANATYFAFCSKGVTFLMRCKYYEVFDIYTEKCVAEPTSLGTTPTIRELTSSEPTSLGTTPTITELTSSEPTSLGTTPTITEATSAKPTSLETTLTITERTSSETTTTQTTTTTTETPTDISVHISFIDNYDSYLPTTSPTRWKHKGKYSVRTSKFIKK